MVGVHRFLSLVLVAVLTAVAFLAGAVSPATAAGGTELLTESFSETSVADPAWQPLDDACLTHATATGSSSTLGKCAHRTDAPAQSLYPGFLQLTDYEKSDKGGVVYNKAIPANGGMEVTFDQYQFGPHGSSSGADGIGFFLTDGAAQLTTTGGVGGSLGYAQNTGQNPHKEGVNAGYLGLGLDAYGNFSADTEGRGAGCQNHAGNDRIANTVALRGPGQGFNGYCLLKTSTTQILRQDLTASQATSPPASAGRTVKISISAEATPTVTVSLGSIGGALNQVLQYKMTQQAPASYKLGFSASTGGSEDTHLIRNVSVSSVTTLGSLNLVKQVDKTTTQPGSYKEGDTVPYSFVASNTSTVLLNQLVITDPKISSVSCPVTSLPPQGVHHL